MDTDQYYLFGFAFLLIGLILSLYLLKKIINLQNKNSYLLEKLIKQQEKNSDILKQKVFWRIKLLDQKIKKYLSYEYKQNESLLALRSLVDDVSGSVFVGLRGWSLSPDAILLLVQIINRDKPKTIVEFGSGKSSVIIAKLVEEYGGKITTFDHGEEFANNTIELGKKEGLTNKNLQVNYRPLSTQKIQGKTYLWYDLKDGDLPKNIDLVVVDGPYSREQSGIRHPSLPIVYANLSNKSTLLLDDTDRDEEKLMIANWQKEFKGLRIFMHNTEKGAVEINVTKAN